jgi:hypothetical protein
MKWHGNHLGPNGNDKGTMWACHMNIMRMLLEHEKNMKTKYENFFVICYPLVWKIIQHNL